MYSTVLQSAKIFRNEMIVQSIILLVGNILLFYIVDIDYIANEVYILPAFMIICICIVIILQFNIKKLTKQLNS